MRPELRRKINLLAQGLGLQPFEQPSLFESSNVPPLGEELKNNDGLLLCGENSTYLENMVEENISINFCYIDPPYNTQNKFIYNDDRVSEYSNIWGNHAGWMSFMLPRLYLAKELLSDDGIIAVSIDDYEQHYLKVLLDRVFGEENYLGNIVVCRSKNGKGSKAGIATNHEYVILYRKSNVGKIRGLPDYSGVYDCEDEYGRYKKDGLFRKKGDASKREDRPNMFYPLYYDKDGKVFTENVTGDLNSVLPKDSKGVERRWLWGKEKATTDSWKLYASPKGVIYVKNYASPEKRIKVRSLWTENRYLTERATNEIKEIYNNKVFDTPKPIELIEDLIDACCEPNSTILDFFAGTGTTAHAAHNLNKVDSGRRKVILVESTDEIPSRHEASKSGFKNISEITETRLQYIQNLDTEYIYTAFK